MSKSPGVKELIGYSQNRLVILRCWKVFSTKPYDGDVISILGSMAQGKSTFFYAVLIAWKTTRGWRLSSMANKLVWSKWKSDLVAKHMKQLTQMRQQIWVVVFQSFNKTYVPSHENDSTECDGKGRFMF